MIDVELLQSFASLSSFSAPFPLHFLDQLLDFLVHFEAVDSGWPKNCNNSLKSRDEFKYLFDVFY